MRSMLRNCDSWMKWFDGNYKYDEDMGTKDDSKPSAVTPAARASAAVGRGKERGGPHTIESPMGVARARAHRLPSCTEPSSGTQNSFVGPGDNTMQMDSRKRPHERTRSRGE